VNNVSGEQVGGPSGEEGKGGLPILSEGYVIFGPLIWSVIFFRGPTPSLLISTMNRR